MFHRRQRDAAVEVPPGGDDPLDERERADHSYLLRRVARDGPVFSGTAWGHRYVCIVGLERCRRFLDEHADRVTPVSQDLTGAVPGGAMRMMHGDAHRDYRGRLVRGLGARSSAEVASTIIEPLVVDALAAWAATDLVDADIARIARRFSAAMIELGTHILVALMFGASGGEREELEAGFRELGPHGLVWNLGPRQFAAYNALCDMLRSQLARPEGTLDESSPLVVLQRAGALDDTMLGNLIHMVEMGRQDIANFLRWSTRTVATVPGLAEAVIADEERATAVVLELLRHHQSERMERRAEQDLVFDGYSIPAGTYVRLCLWESHHDEAAFPDPMRFDWTRFSGTPPSSDVYAPFGLGTHQCPYGGINIQIGSTFIRRLATGYDVTLLADGPPVRGPYHWEASRTMAIRFEARC